MTLPPLDAATAMLVVLVAALVATITDVWKFKVSNLLTWPLLLSGLAYHWLSQGPSGLAMSLLGALFGFAVLLPVFLLNGVGGGDVKLLAAAGAWVCWPWAMIVFVAAALAQGVYAVVLILACRNWAETWVNLKIMCYRIYAVGKYLGADEGVEVEAGRRNRRRLIPFAAMLACGILILLVFSHVVAQVR
jgi:prepilin peptidase CpaA